MRRRNVNCSELHVPVMLGEVVDALNPANGDVIVDGTFGAGGYARAILQDAQSVVIGIDRDADALEAGAALVEAYSGRLSLLQGRFSEMLQMVRGHGVDTVDGVVLDLGVSSMQIDRAERGFSFFHDGPLDMRMAGPRGAEERTAAAVVNGLDEDTLATVLWRLGEERRSRRIAREIVKARADAPIETTRQLASIVERAAGGRGGSKIHPATRTFQALRIYVNSELHELAHGLGAAEQLLKTGGRLVVVSFHSLEDRIVKTFFKTRSDPPRRSSRHLPDLQQGEAIEPSFKMLRRGATGPAPAEVERNPRARSARLRAGERTAAPAMPLDPTVFKLVEVSD